MNTGKLQWCPCNVGYVNTRTGRVARCPVFRRTVRFLTNLSGEQLEAPPDMQLSGFFKLQTDITTFMTIENNGFYSNFYNLLQNFAISLHSINAART